MAVPFLWEALLHLLMSLTSFRNTEHEEGCFTLSSVAVMLSKRRMTFLPGINKPCKSSDIPETLETELAVDWLQLLLSFCTCSSSFAIILEVNVPLLVKTAGDCFICLFESSSCCLDTSRSPCFRMMFSITADCSRSVRRSMVKLLCLTFSYTHRDSLLHCACIAIGGAHSSKVRDSICHGPIGYTLKHPYFLGLLKSISRMCSWVAVV